MNIKIRQSVLLILFLGFSPFAFGQFGEPEVRGRSDARSLYNDGFRSGFGFLFTVNDFGVGVGGQYRRVFRNNTEGLLSIRVTGIRDPKEQTYIDYYFGYRTTPDKYQRIISFPLNIGVKQRLFARHISDNFRVFTSLSGGPMLAYSFPYFDDVNGNGFQENNEYLYGSNERAYDIFTGWRNGKPHFGLNGDVEVGIDFGNNFARLTTLQFGYTFNYFKDGLQIMQPKKPMLDAQGNLQFDNGGNLLLEDFNGKRKFYGSVQISFMFGWMWK